MPTLPKGNRRPWIPKKRKVYGQTDNSSFSQSKQWRMLRRYYIKANPLCEECSRKGRTTAVNCIDHIKPISKSVRRVVIDQSGYENVPVFDRDNLLDGHEILGPAIIDQLDSTTLILRDQKLKVDKFGNLLIRECFNE
jgi:N-methylhydantoinase A/oxoprolinase/acetone carboxylase beta subunit